MQLVTVENRAQTTFHIRRARASDQKLFRKLMTRTGCNRHKLVCFPSFVTDLASYCATTSQKMSVFSWGTFEDGAMGVSIANSGVRSNGRIQEELLPSRMESLRDYEIKDIIAGDSHSLAIDSNGILHAWLVLILDS